MKRCPECLFLYPDSDEKCDFDQTVLESVNDAEIEAATNPPKPGRKRRKTLSVAAVGGLILGILVFAIYFAMSRQAQKTSAVAPQSPAPVTFTAPQPVVTAPSPSPSVSPSPSPSPSPTKTSPNTVSTAHSRATSDPVSTSGPGIGTRQGSKPVIMLTSGGKIDADEVWRTKDGVWYRRNGMVTLLKRNQVKAIVTR
jgi:cytoskeletal protein RodZ